MPLDDNGVVLAAVSFGVGARMWATFMTVQVQALKKETRRITHVLALMLEELAGHLIEEGNDTYAAHRDSGRVLDDFAARLQRARR